MKLKELMVEQGDKIRRESWSKDDYLIVSNPMAYRGIDFGFMPEYYSPEGMLYHEKGRCPFWIFWIFPNNHNDWVKI